MEKIHISLNEEIVYLKKSLKNKRRAEIWEQSIQYYRNHQNVLSNYHILKIIKIAMKPLKATIYGSFKNISKLAKQREISMEDKKINEDIRQKIEFLRVKMKALSNLLESYTVVLQAFLYGSDPLYFKMLFRQNYHSKLRTKELFFEPVFQKQDKADCKYKLQHEISSYLKFVCIAANLFCTYSLICEDQVSTKEHFRMAEKALSNIFGNTSKFAVKKLEFQILKLNLLQKLEDSKKYLVKFEYPIDIFNLLYKNFNKWDSIRVKTHYKLLLRYIFTSLANIHHVTLPKNHLNLETEIYIVIKELSIMNKNIFIASKNQFYKRSAQVMNSFVDSYELRLNQTLIWADFLKNFFNYEELQKMSSKVQNPDSKIQNNKQFCNLSPSRREQSQLRSKNFSVFSLKSTHYKKQKQQKGCQNCFGNKVYALLPKIGNVFNLIQQSDSDQEGEKRHKFEAQRADQIKQIQGQKYKIKKQNLDENSEFFQSTNSNIKNTAVFMDIKNVEQKLSQLSNETARFRSFSTAAIQQLTQRKSKNQVILKLNTMDSLLKPQKLQRQKAILSIGYRNQNISSEKSSKKSWYKKQTCVLLPAIKKQSDEPTQKPKPHYSIMLSQKYDKISRMLLLSNTNNQKVLNI